MDIEQINLLRAALPAGRTLYSYYKDRYSLQLLRYALPAPTPIAALRNGPLASLLQKPRVKQVLAHCGKMLTPQTLTAADGDAAACHYTLSLANWVPRRWRSGQVSRPGGNVVLQLNFSQAHNREFRRLLRPTAASDPFNCASHPSLVDQRPDRRYTLAWARLDIDLDHGEALIEEIQSDWVREAAYALDQAERRGELPMWAQRRYGFRGEAPMLRKYCDDVLKPHREHWAEAMLSAAVYLLREEIGIRSIFMHTPESGTALKNIRWSAPPRSLYSALPQQFCFRRTETIPRLLAQNRRAVGLLRRTPSIGLQHVQL